MQRNYVRWYSPHLDRDMEFLWFGWSGRPVLMFPTSGGRFFENEDFNLIAAVADQVEAGQIQVICVDSIDRESWYNRAIHPHDRARRHDGYDRYLRYELIPYVQHRSQRGDLVTYGASFGAYHAANLAGRYPELISRAILFSGIYDLNRVTNGYMDELCYFHSPASYIGNIDWGGAQRLRQVQWIVATGEHDTLVDDNRGFAWLLEVKGIGCHSEIWPGVFGHDWPWWRANLGRFLP